VPYFDFNAHMRRYKLVPWRVARVGRRVRHTFAQHFVLGAEYKKTHNKIRTATNTLRELWAQRLLELVSRRLWFPGSQKPDPHHPDFDLRKFELTYRRCLFCRPAYLYFAWRRKTTATFRPCHKSQICPFCAARVAAVNYRYVKSTMRELVKKAPRTKCVVACRIVGRDFLAPAFHPLHGCEDDQISEYIKLMQAEIAAHKTAYQQVAKQLQRRTLGSMAHIVVVPLAAGWRVETRQFVLQQSNKSWPRVKLRNGKVLYAKSAPVVACCTPDGAKFFDIFGAFSQYPRSLLTGYVEFTAAYLVSTAGTRLSSGTGLFKKTGRRLIPYYRQKDADARARKKELQASRGAAENDL